MFYLHELLIFIRLSTNSMIQYLDIKQRKPFVKYLVDFFCY